MPNIKLKTSDGKVFVVDVKTIAYSKVLSTMIEYIGLTEDEEDIISLNRIRSDILEKVFVWCRYYKNNPELIPRKTGSSQVEMTSWETGYLDVDHRTLIDLIIAADYLNIEGLLELTTDAVANMVKGKTAACIRATFNIQHEKNNERKKWWQIWKR